MRVVFLLYSKYNVCIYNEISNTLSKTLKRQLKEITVFVQLRNILKLTILYLLTEPFLFRISTKDHYKPYAECRLKHPEISTKFHIESNFSGDVVDKFSYKSFRIAHNRLIKSKFSSIFFYEIKSLT